MQLITVALDDNDEAWHEMFLPFISSLAETNYTGRVAVISYGLDPGKRARLCDNGIVVVERGARSLRVENDRYLAVGEVLRHHPECDKLALYDADVWFVRSDMDLFTHISDPKRIYACTDAWASRFIHDSVIGPEKGAIEHACIVQTQAIFGAVLQAGLVAGMRSAWAGFIAHCRTHLDRVGVDFADIYGLDSALLNLYADAATLTVLDEAYNYLPKRGITLSAPGEMRTISGKGIIAMHMTGETRYFDRWRYQNLRPSAAIEGARPFALAADQYQIVDGVSIGKDCTQAMLALGWRVTGLRQLGTAHCLCYDAARALCPDADIVFATIGSVEITLEAVRAGASLRVSPSYLATQPSPARIGLVSNGHRHILGYPSLMTIIGELGDSVTLWSEAVPGQRASTLWSLAAGD